MKTIKAYKSIGEVAKLLNLVNEKSGKPSTYTIRFWEKNFPQVKPKKFDRSRRYYDEDTINYGENIDKNIDTDYNNNGNFTKESKNLDSESSIAYNDNDEKYEDVFSNILDSDSSNLDTVNKLIDSDNDKQKSKNKYFSNFNSFSKAFERADNVFF